MTEDKRKRELKAAFAEKRQEKDDLVAAVDDTLARTVEKRAAYPNLLREHIKTEVDSKYNRLISADVMASSYSPQRIDWEEELSRVKRLKEAKRKQAECSLLIVELKRCILAAEAGIAVGDAAVHAFLGNSESSVHDNN